MLIVWICVADLVGFTADLAVVSTRICAASLEYDGAIGEDGPEIGYGGCRCVVYL